MKTLLIVTTFFLFIFINNSYCSGKEELNSVLGFKIGMTKDSAIALLNEMELNYSEYPENEELNFKYDILQDTKEMNLIRLFFKDDKLDQIWVYFYKYNMINRAQTSRRFHDYLIELDKIYNNDITWRDKWQNKDGSLIVKKGSDVMLESGYDVLIIQAN